MLTTSEILDLIKKTNGDCSDYRVAKLLELTPQTVSLWTCKGTIMSDETGIKAAELLQIDPEYVVMCLHVERAKDGASKELLERICLRLLPKKKAAKAA